MQFIPPGMYPSSQCIPPYADGNRSIMLLKIVKSEQVPFPHTSEKGNRHKNDLYNISGGLFLAFLKLYL